MKVIFRQSAKAKKKAVLNIDDCWRANPARLHHDKVHNNSSNGESKRVTAEWDSVRWSSERNDFIEVLLC